MKRLLEVVFLLLLLGTLFPLFILVSLVVLFFSGRPYFFYKNVLGKMDVNLYSFKFRTMITGAETMQVKYRKMNEANGPVFKIHDDPRFTKVGKFLSHTGLDELPQLFNILKGEMAFFGPRPLPLPEAAKLTKRQQQRHRVRPGIISPWVLDGYHHRSFEEWMESDVEYVKQKSLQTDMFLLVRSIPLLLGLLRNEML